MKRLTILIVWFLISLQLFSQNANSGMRDGISAIEIAADMAPGLNLYNTLDAACQGLESETCWGNPYTTFEMVEAMAVRGFKTLRIPVTWGNHMGAAPDYIIDNAWMDRVEEVVNYALDNGMYAIVNIHHDDEHFVPTYDKQEEGTAWLEKAWMQIATRFKDYGDYLIFETLNEPRAIGTPQEWTGGSAEHRDVVNAYIQAAVDIIRGTGGNNETRFIMVQQVGANGNPAISDLIIPNNDANIIVSVHNYYPYSFCLDGNGTSTWGTTKEIKDLENAIKSVADHFVANGQAVVMGEWGAGDKDNYDQRANYYNEFTKICKNTGVTPIVWIYGFNRSTLTWVAPMIEEGILRHYRDTIIDIESLALNFHNDTLYVGDSLPLAYTMAPEGAVSASDIIWTTKNSKVASVDETGLVIAKSKGNTEIRVSYFDKYDACKVIVLDTLTYTQFHIEAENFDNQSGVQIEACEDENGGQDIGYIEDGDWCLYTITIDSAGVYDFSTRVATDANGGSIELSTSNDEIGEVKVDASKSNGWQDWYTTDPIEVSLNKGIYDFKLTFKGGGGSLFNVNWFDLNYSRPLNTSSIKEMNIDNVLDVYPNPFSEVLHINYELSSKSDVKLTVLDMSGSVKQLLTKENNKMPGKYTCEWNGAGLPNGIYFLKLELNGRTETKKLILN